MNGTCRVVLASGVRHAVEYGKLLAGHPGAEVVAVVEDPAVASWMVEDSRSVAADLGVPMRLGAPSSGDADLAVICCEPTRHAALATAWLEAGVPVLVDKPVATTLDDAVAVGSVVSGTGLLAAAVTRIGVPAIRRARAEVHAGRVGMPRHVDVEFLASGTHFATSVERPGLVVDPRLSGGGELLNFFGYAVDYVRYLTGCEVVDVHAESGTLFGGPHAEHGVEDCAVLSLGCTNGLTGTVTVGRVPAAPGNGPNAVSVRLLGSHGHLVADDERPAVDVHLASGTTASRNVGGAPVAAGLRWLLDDVLAALGSGRRPAYDITDACASIAAIDAAYRSAETGQPAEVRAWS
jgi:myo-inositol 2-dehydrogenase / D-chiro-inositol 1-dehydrogenase